LNPRLNVNSSDLDTARSAASRARGAAGVQQEIPPYIRFGKPPAAPVREAVPDDDDLHSDTTWRTALARSLKITTGAGILVMDENALIIAAEGPWEAMSAEQFELLGPRLNAALDQAAHIEGDQGPCRAIAIQAGSFWLTGIRLAGERLADQITIGVAAPFALSLDLQQRVEGLIRKALG
jgi:hypothetical protein